MVVEPPRMLALKLLCIYIIIMRFYCEIMLDVGSYARPVSIYIRVMPNDHQHNDRKVHFGGSRWTKERNVYIYILSLLVAIQPYRA